MKFILSTIIFVSVLLGCASSTELDRSKLNHASMDISQPLLTGEPSPVSGLRNLTTNSGGSSCSVCAH